MKRAPIASPSARRFARGVEAASFASRLRFFSLALNFRLPDILRVSHGTPPGDHMRCLHTPAWARGEKTCLRCHRIPVQWEASAEAASRSALQWLRENGFLPPLYGPIRPFHVEHGLPPPPVPRGVPRGLPLGSPRQSEGALSEPARPARPRGMNDTETCLYWATESWLEKDVASETGLPPDMCAAMWREIDRVRALFRASIQLVPPKA